MIATWAWRCCKVMRQSHRHYSPLVESQDMVSGYEYNLKAQVLMVGCSVICVGCIYVTTPAPYSNILFNILKVLYPDRRRRPKDLFSPPFQAKTSLLNFQFFDFAFLGFGISTASRKGGKGWSEITTFFHKELLASMHDKLNKIPDSRYGQHSSPISQSFP